MTNQSRAENPVASGGYQLVATCDSCARPEQFCRADEATEAYICQECDAEPRRCRTLTLYRDDSTVQVRYERVKAVFWTAGNSVLVIARWDAETGDGHHYIHWPRERFCWFKDGGESHG